MISVQPPSPDDELSLNDPGDDVASRYRFQWTWAAIVSCMLLDDTQDVIQIFCEHHEDVLLASRRTVHWSSMKTRKSDQPVWRADAPQFQNAFVKFVQLDSMYPGYFRAFRFLTCHPLHVANTSSRCRLYLRKSPMCRRLRISIKRSSLVTSIAKEADVADVAAFQTLKKSTATDGLPKLQDSFHRLVNTLTGCWSGAADCSYESVRRAARAPLRNVSEHRRLIISNHFQLISLRSTTRC